MFKNKKRAVVFVVMVLILLGLLVKQSIEELTINKFGHFVKGPKYVGWVKPNIYFFCNSLFIFIIKWQN